MKKLEIGMYYEEIFSFSQEDVNMFCKLSGDNNPIHHDSDFASKTIFKTPIVHGLLSGSIFSKIIGTKFPGPGSIYLSQNLKFHKPVYVNEKYLARLKIKDIFAEKITLSTFVLLHNVHTKIISGEAKIIYDEKIFK